MIFNSSQSWDILRVGKNKEQTVSKVETNGDKRVIILVKIKIKKKLILFKSDYFFFKKKKIF
jgi:hypothetical protein